MYCIRCHQPLAEVYQDECPKCGLQFDPLREETFTKKPPFLFWNYWLPGFLASVISGIISYAACLMGGQGDLGYALFVAVPISAGVILGYGTQTRFWLLILLGLGVTASIVCALVFANVSGIFCGLMLSVIFLMPLVIGLGIGAALRYILKVSNWNQRWYLPLLAFIALPYVVQFIEDRFPRRTEIATVRTELHMHATPQEAWDAVMFYEEVEHDPPMLLDLSLPKTIGSQGRKDRVGEIVRCQYDRGWLVKRISKVEPGQALEFEVIEQHLHFERDVTLTGGSFRIEKLDDGTARVVLTTDYERHLHPGWLWTPVEKEVVHTLHEHVLEGMRRKAEGVDDSISPQPYQPDGDEELKTAGLECSDRYAGSPSAVASASTGASSAQGFDQSPQFSR